MTGPNETDHPDVWTFPPVLAIAALAIAIVLEFLAPLAFLPEAALSGWQVYAGALLILFGLLLAGWAIWTFNRAGTNVSPFKPSLELATEGPYRFSRNPIYIWFLLALAGVSLIFSLEWGLILIPALMLALEYVIIRKEEVYLEAKFGDTYRDFKKRTRRWL